MGRRRGPIIGPGQAEEERRRQRWREERRSRSRSQRKVLWLAADTQTPSHTQWWSLATTLHTLVSWLQ